MGESGRWLLNGRQKKTEAWWYLARQLTWLPRIHLPPWWLAAHARWAEFWVFVGKRLFVAPLGEFGMGGSHFYPKQQQLHRHVKSTLGNKLVFLPFKVTLSVTKRSPLIPTLLDSSHTKFHFSTKSHVSCRTNFPKLLHNAISPLKCIVGSITTRILTVMNPKSGLPVQERKSLSSHSHIYRTTD